MSGKDQQQPHFPREEIEAQGGENVQCRVTQPVNGRAGCLTRKGWKFQSVTTTHPLDGFITRLGVSVYCMTSVPGIQ